jgi:hypothetical protein
MEQNDGGSFAVIVRPENIDAEVTRGCTTSGVEMLMRSAPDVMCRTGAPAGKFT